MYRVETVPVSRLKEYANNPRNNDLAVDKVAESIKRLGFLFPVIVDAEYTIVCGHVRKKACEKLGIPTVPCIKVTDLTETQLRYFRLVDNRTTEYAEWDLDKLQIELNQIDMDMEENFSILRQFDLDTFINEDSFSDIPDAIAMPAQNFMDADPFALYEEEDEEAPAGGMAEGTDTPALARKQETRDGTAPTESHSQEESASLPDTVQEREQPPGPGPMVVNRQMKESNGREPDLRTDPAEADPIEPCQAPASDDLEPSAGSSEPAGRDPVPEEAAVKQTGTTADADMPESKRLLLSLGTVRIFLSRVEFKTLDDAYARYLDAGTSEGFVTWILRGGARC